MDSCQCLHAESRVVSGVDEQGWFIVRNDEIKLPVEKPVDWPANDREIKIENLGMRRRGKMASDDTTRRGCWDGGTSPNRIGRQSVYGGLVEQKWYDTIGATGLVGQQADGNKDCLLYRDGWWIGDWEDEER